MTSDRTERARRYLAQTTETGDIAELAEAPHVPGEEAAMPGGTEAREIVKKVGRGAHLDRAEEFALEAIIIPDRRPAIDIVDGTYEVRHADWTRLNAPAARAVLEPVFASVGRVELPGHPTLPYGGTAFVVGPDLLMTNRHVAEIFASGLGVTGLRFVPGVGAAVDFGRERGDTFFAPEAATGLVMVHPYWDMALFRIAGLSAGRLPLALSVTEIEASVGREVAVVGYPAFDPRNPHDVQREVFGDTYGVKRLQPGVVRARGLIGSYGNVVAAATHDASTLGGNSGSCVIDIETGQVLALHFGGRYLEANYAVAASDLARDGRVIDAGVGFAGMPQRGPVAWDADWQALAQEGEARGAGPFAGGAAAAPVTGPLRTQVGADGGLRVTVPLEIDIAVGAARLMEDAAERPPRGKPHYDADYATRRGYDPDFLAVSAPMPVPRHPEDFVPTLDGTRILHYHHFSLVMHRDRRIAAMSAANVDASHAAKRPGNRPAADYTRDGLAGRSSDAWFPDPRIGVLAQIPEVFFDEDRSAFDKGHLVRRDDVAWGATYEEMRNANGDSFHVTNCTPQVSVFNQSRRGTDNWGDLENLILGQADSEKLCVFGGPVLDDSDPTFAGQGAIGALDLLIPQRYWKIVVAEKDGSLQCFAFILRQDLSDVAFEFAVPVRWTRFMVPVHEIEALSGFDFDPAFHAGDQFGTEMSAQIAAAAGVATAGAREGDAAAAVDAVGDVLEVWREDQAEGVEMAEAEVARFVAEFDRAVTDAEIATALNQAMDLQVEVGPLFPHEPEGRFRIIDVPGIYDADRADLFDLARAMQVVLGAVTVEPDLDSRYYDADGAAPGPGVAESADVAFWCWADDDDAPPDIDWAIRKMRLPQAWALSDSQGRPARGQGAIVFQPDTGVVRTHPDVPADLADDPRAENFIERGTPPVDPMTGSGNLGHGTGTGSVLASPVGERMTGAAPAATLVPLRALRSVVRFNQSRVAQAVEHARVNGAHVISMSLGGVPSRALRRALNRAVADNIIVIAAAGNCVETVVWPARYAACIAIGGTNFADRRWQGSSRGSAVDISAPAEFVLRANARDPGDPGDVSGGQGTSFATALTAGLAACWLAHHGRATLIAGLAPGETLQDRFRAVLRATARVPPGFDTGRMGAGIVDAEALIDVAAPAGAPEAVAARPRSTEEEVLDLLRDVGAGGQLEAAAMAVGDPQSVLELATVGLDMARFRNRQHGRLEAQPPVALSAGLKRLLGANAANDLARGAV